MKNKKGQVGLWVFGAIFLVALVAVVGIGFNVLNQGVAKGVGEETGCNVNPTISSTVTDAKQSTTVAATTQASVNGGKFSQFTSTTNFPKDSSVDVFLNISGYADKVIENAFTKISCGNNPLDLQLLATPAPSLEVIGSGNAVLSVGTNAGSGTVTNQSQSTGSITDKLRVTVAKYKATGDFVMVVDANDSSVVSSIDSDYPSVGIPNNYKSFGGTSRVKAFKVPSIDLSQTEIPFTFNPVTDMTINGTAVNVTLYGSQDIIDVNGAITKSVIENSDGTAKYDYIVSTAFFISCTSDTTCD